MRVIISGGGTGGHIYPAISIANTIKEKNPEAEIVFIGTEKGLESDIVPRAGYKIKFITVSYLRRRISFHNVKSVGMLMKGLLEARKIIKDFKPDVVIGTGGFVCGPVLYMASKLKIKTLIHEQNVFPGLTNRILSKYVTRIALSFEEANTYFKTPEKLVVTGNPIRKEFLEVTEGRALERYKKVAGLPLVLVVGGSGGATKINNAVVELLEAKGHEQYKIVLVTGKRHYDGVQESLKQKKVALKHHEVIPYMNDMPYALKACDVIVCSAGAITIAEVTALGKPSIMIPKAYTAENHQEYNARALAEKGAAVMIKESELNGLQLQKVLKEILSSPTKLENMKKASRRLAKIEAADQIYDEILKLIKKK